MKKKDVQQSSSRPPIIAVLGHVDHGKTTLLDFIRKTEVAAREHGGITQRIGAYQIQTKGRVITFIDTPGHEAFAKMRSRGAGVADLAILVVAADDSVKPQTVESISQIKAAGIPMIVAANKIDLETANLEKLKSDLAKHEVQVEGFGGDVPIAPISAKTGKGVPELLDLITLMVDMKPIANAPGNPFLGVVIETRLDKGKGMVATVIVKEGTLKFGTTLYEGAKVVAKVRALFDEFGKAITEAPPSKPVEILGFQVSPSVGTVLADYPIIAAPAPAADPAAPVIPIVAELPDFLKPVGEQALQTLPIVLKADTAGSLEAIIASLDPRVLVVSQGVGDIGDADILTAKSNRAIAIGFNVKIAASVEKLAQTEKVVYRLYKIIYELLEELAEVVSGLREVLAAERELGVGSVIAEFPYEKNRVAGTKITSGRLARGDTVKILRDEAEIGRAKIKSIRKGKEEVNKAESPVECGILLDKKVDFALGDAIIAVTI